MDLPQPVSSAACATRKRGSMPRRSAAFSAMGSMVAMNSSDELKRVLLGELGALFSTPLTVNGRSFGGTNAVAGFQSPLPSGCTPSAAAVGAVADTLRWGEHT